MMRRVGSPRTPGLGGGEHVSGLAQVEGFHQAQVGVRERVRIAERAHYIAMRALGYPDAFPHADLGLMKALDLRKPRDMLAAAEPWRPWRAYAAHHLWASLK